ncbi:DUF2804 domain-containing protein [Spongiibacter nanhainus]|uniref:DUF2804 domain-containing protein n=1 Tax=Spongiibacter nanhainus TaxID=2794344 RepID=A0A7T4R125_9GAMM|nr:DUF2804 domain-containing protein [Spongiibacter nanhainus]QQD18460.1 DUF2804 domain-containing protein [Spongiibacter nanhainus]
MARQQPLVDGAGRIQFGPKPNGVSEVNFRDFPLQTAMDRRLPRWRRYWAFNQFQFVALSHSDLLVGVAIADLKLVSNAFVYLFQPSTGAFEEFSFLQPLARHTGISTNPEAGVSTFSRGSNRVEMHSSQGQRQLIVTIADGPTIQARFDDRHCQAPLGLCTRSGYQGWTYTHKNAALPVAEGTIHWRGKNYSLSPQQTLASIDWSGGYMRRETAWNWASLSTRLEDGRRLGLNLAAGVNETGYSENSAWLDGRRTDIDLVDFQFDRQDHTAPWRVRSRDGAIDLDFVPAGKRQEKINAGLIASNFRQFFGRFSGTLTLQGEVLSLSDHWGLTEDHYARW